MKKGANFFSTLYRTRWLLVVFIASIAVISVLLMRLEGLKSTNPFIVGPQAYPSGNILFFSDDCSHCAKVDAFIDDHEAEKHLSFTRMSIFHNQGNLNVLMEKANTCELDSSQIGVPFFWDDEKKQCIVGYVDIISFLQERLKTAP